MSNNSKTQPIVVITGASGFLGESLIAYFLAKKWKIHALVRNPSKSPKRSGVTYFAYDLSTPVPEEALKGTDYLIHAAYVKYNKLNPNALKINVNGAKAILASARHHKLKKTLFMSTMSAHGDATSVYGKQKLKIEGLFNDKKSVVIRSGLILGNGGIVKDMTDFMKSKHAVPLIGGGKQPLQVIGVYNLCEVIEVALTNSFSGLYTVATPQIYTYKDFYKALSKSIHTKVVFVPLPFFALIGAIKLIRALRLPLNVSEDNALGLKALKSVDNKKDIEKLGVEIDSLEKILKRPGIVS